MEVDGTSSNGSNSLINNHPWPIHTEDNLQRNENQATDFNPSVSKAPTVPTQLTQRQGSATTNVIVPPKAPSLFIVQPSSKKQSKPPSRYRLELPKLCTPPRTSSRSLISGTTPPNTDETSSSLSNPPPSLIAPLNRATYSNPNSMSTVQNFTISTPAIRKTLPIPVMPLLHTPTQSRPRVLPSTTNVQQQVNPISNTPSPVEHFTLSLKQPSTTSSQLASLTSQSTPPVSHPLPSTVSQTNTPVKYTPVNNSFPHPLQTSQLTPPQSSSITLNNLSQVQPSLSTTAPAQAGTNQSIVTGEVRMNGNDQDTRYEQTTPSVGNPNESLPVQSSEQDNVHETVNTEEYKCDTNHVGNNVTGLSGTEHSLFVSETAADTNDQLYTNYGTEYGGVGDGGCSNYQESEGFQGSNQGGAMV